MSEHMLIAEKKEEMRNDMLIEQNMRRDVDFFLENNSKVCIAFNSVYAAIQEAEAFGWDKDDVLRFIEEGL